MKQVPHVSPLFRTIQEHDDRLRAVANRVVVPFAWMNWAIRRKRELIVAAERALKPASGQGAFA